MKLLVKSIGLAIAVLGLGAPTSARSDNPAATALSAALDDAVGGHRISGAVVAVANANGEGAVHAAGIADADGRKIDPRTDRFLIASVTKTMTAVAVLQLVDRSKIASLDDPANKYLTRTQLPDWEGTQVTVRHLLTHSSGLRDLSVGFITRSAAPVPMSAAGVRANTPTLVRKPGQYIVYSNAGIALLGMLVEDVSGQSFGDYLEQELFQPLEMDSAIVNYLPQPADPYARSFTVAAGVAPQAITFDTNTAFMAPAGSVMATATDMQRYIAFWLDAGKSWSSAILSRAMFQQALTPQLRNHAGADAMGLGVFLDDRGGETLITHTGEFAGYTSYLSVSPQSGLGIFMVTAGGPPGGAGRFAAYSDGAEQIDVLLRTRSLADAQAAPLSNASRYTGTYLGERRFSRGVPNVVGLQATINVTSDEDGFLHVNGGPALGLIAPGLVAEVVEGKVVRSYGLSADEPLILMNADFARKAQWYERQNVLLIAGGGGALLVLIGLLLGITGGHATRLVWLAPVVALISLAAISASLLTVFPTGAPLVADMVTGSMARLYFINVLAWVVIAAAIVIWLIAMRVGLQSGSGWRRKVSLAITSLGAVMMCFFVLVSGIADPGVL